ncbi:glycoside/pentoside/hexuronide:cation symporter, GPH family [Cognatiyoonia sediminum]|uniref:Glycoside/pentoside/hexuronide:cation symporter, GPH family n=1 Tax=Cognatiyoonia sediminum TaxID=1508389 RepID=A0A1M5RFS6_9RHOB|nr:MFS transporter [Cognatiyoonia sediminum]SHH24603.1 glycoside/pentoside/hexuronide:cation symporter, GPH family [Cognatiyoonia sediminum]
MNALGQRLPAYSLFAAVIAAAGLPIYIYAPKYYADTYGVSLTALGALLFALRLFDVVQDPVLGWISERLRGGKAFWVSMGAVLLAVSMWGLFAVDPLFDPIWWFGLTITGLFTAFSFLTINFYAQGVGKASQVHGGHVRLAAWRETGGLLGVCIAAVAPTIMMGSTENPFAVFAGGFVVVVAVATLWMWPEWSGRTETEPTEIREIIADPLARRLLILALFNATPLAVSSTLFLFFVESRLGAVGWEGPLLVLFFLAAAISAPLWSKLAQRYGAKGTLLTAMALAILSFAYALTLSTGDEIQFAVICVLSGATIGADLTLLPAMFARRMSVVSPNGGQGFGLWSLVSKFTLAFAAVILLPILENAGFAAGQTDLPESALTTLTVLYAGVPCILKLVAVAILATTTLEE